MSPRPTGFPLNSARLFKNCGSTKAYDLATLPPFSYFPNATTVAAISKSSGFSRHEFLSLCDLWGWVCFYCGEEIDVLSAEPDHMTPKSRGGPDILENIAPACHRCNRKKGTMTVDEFRQSHAWEAL